MKKEEIKKEKSLSDNDFSKIEEIIKGSLFDDTSSNNVDSAKELEVAKLVLATTLNKNFTESLTNLTDEEIDDISDGFMINEILDSNLIDIKIEKYMLLKRSLTKEPKNLLSLLTEIVGKAVDINTVNPINRILGKDKMR